jgi:hypothetical protein
MCRYQPEPERDTSIEMDEVDEFDEVDEVDEVDEDDADDADTDDEDDEFDEREFKRLQALYDYCKRVSPELIEKFERLWEAKLAKEKFDSDSHGNQHGNQASMP